MYLCITTHNSIKITIPDYTFTTNYMTAFNTDVNCRMSLPRFSITHITTKLHQFLIHSFQLLCEGTETHINIYTN